MKQSDVLSRRNFLAATSAGGALIASAKPSDTQEAAGGRPALLGGTPVRTTPFPTWPVSGEEEEQAMIRAIRSKCWFRGGPNDRSAVKEFESAYARLTGAKYCLATSSCTGALETSLGALGVGPGDEVILPPYTFIATLNVILMRHALPVFVDTELETAQIDPAKIGPAITERTAAVIPVHLGGAAADLDSVLAVARKHKLPVIEDAAQAHLAQWRGRSVGTYGDCGCFSFQASKNLNCGEGGAIITDNEELYAKAFAFHWNGRALHSGTQFSDAVYGTKFCMTAFQAAMLLAQMERIEQFARTREQNAQYLTSMLREIPGIAPMRQYPGCTRNAYHGYLFRYLAEPFGGLSFDKFCKAVQAEGIPMGGGYSPLNSSSYVRKALRSKAYQRIYSAAELNALEERNHCPANDQLCREAIWIGQTMMLAGRRDMEQIAEAIGKVHRHAGELAKA